MQPSPPPSDRSFRPVIKQPRVAVIGTGRISRQHLLFLKNRADIDVVGLCDLSPALARLASERFGGCEYFTDHKRLLAESSPDVVHVTTPLAAHYAITKDALEAGCHVIVEKPLVDSYDKWLDLRQTAQRKGCVILEDYNYAFDPNVQDVIRGIREGRLGRLVHVEAVVSVDCGKQVPQTDITRTLVYDFLPHMVSLCHFTGGPLAVSHRLRPESPDGLEFRALGSCGGATAFLSFSSQAQPNCFHFRVQGTRGRATLDLFELALGFEAIRPGNSAWTPFLNALDESRRLKRQAWSGLWRKISGAPGAYRGLQGLLGLFYDALSGKTALPVTPEDIDHINRAVFDLAGLPRR